MTDSQRLEFQENLLKTMLQLEDTYFSLARTQTRNCLVICDRGAMDCSAYLPREDWERIMERSEFNEVDLRDNRYNQVVHLVTAARGAEEHYTRTNNTARTEDLAAAVSKTEVNNLRPVVRIVFQITTSWSARPGWDTPTTRSLTTPRTSR